MARPRKKEVLATTSVRLPTSLLEEVDACAATLQEETPHLHVTRTDAIRYLIQVGLEHFGYGKKRRPKRSA